MSATTATTITVSVEEMLGISDDLHAYEEMLGCLFDYESTLSRRLWRIMGRFDRATLVPAGICRYHEDIGIFDADEGEGGRRSNLQQMRAREWIDEMLARSPRTATPTASVQEEAAPTA